MHLVVAGVYSAPTEGRCAGRGITSRPARRLRGPRPDEVGKGEVWGLKEGLGGKGDLREGSTQTDITLCAALRRSASQALRTAPTHSQWSTTNDHLLGVSCCWRVRKADVRRVDVNPSLLLSHPSFPTPLFPPRALHLQGNGNEFRRFGFCQSPLSITSQTDLSNMSHYSVPGKNMRRLAIVAELPDFPPKTYNIMIYRRRSARLTSCSRATFLAP